MKTRYTQISPNEEEQKLKLALTKSFNIQFRGIKLPENYSLEMINRQFLASFPQHYFFKYINIISCSKGTSKELDACFIGSAYTEIIELKNKLYKTLNDNYHLLNENEVIFTCVSYVINNIPINSFIRKYISLIDCFTKKMDEDQALLCKLLVLFPSNYEELCSVINISLNLEKLPKNPVDFYSISKFKENINKFNKEDSTSQNDMFNLFMNKISQFESDIKTLKIENTKIREENTKILQENTKIQEENAKKFEIMQKENAKKFEIIQKENIKKDDILQKLQSEDKNKNLLLNSLQLDNVQKEETIKQLKLKWNLILWIKIKG